MIKGRDKPTKRVLINRECSGLFLILVRSVKKDLNNDGLSVQSEPSLVLPIVYKLHLSPLLSGNLFFTSSVSCFALSGRMMITFTPLRAQNKHSLQKSLSNLETLHSLWWFSFYIRLVRKKRELHCHYPKDVPVSSLHPLISLPLLLHKQCPLCHVHQVEPTLDVVTKRSRSPFGYVFLFVI